MGQFLGVFLTLLMSAGIFISSSASAAKAPLVAVNKSQSQKSLQLKALMPISEKNQIYLSKSYYYQAARKAYPLFQSEFFSDQNTDIDELFKKLEKKAIYQIIHPKDAHKFEFSYLTDEVVKYIRIIKSSYGYETLSVRERTLLQMNFYGLIQAIRKANEMNLTIQSDQFEKLEDLLIKHSQVLFYWSYNQVRYTDFFWTSYYLNILNYPMDLTVKHLSELSAKMKNFKYPEKYRPYGEEIARKSLSATRDVSQISAKDLETVYIWAKSSNLNKNELKYIQKVYLKHLTALGISEKANEIKHELAYSLLEQETNNLMAKPWNVLTYLQVLIGYIFIAWPLEIFMLVVAGMIFTVQSKSALTREEERRANRWYKKIWMVFTKSYLGSNVPFFSKLAASLLIFGMGLYFNTAKRFVEAMISSF